jgi:hypothetical protein
MNGQTRLECDAKCLMLLFCQFGRAQSDAKKQLSSQPFLFNLALLANALDEETTDIWELHPS